jgi:hypothetical protein
MLGRMDAAGSAVQAGSGRARRGGRGVRRGGARWNSIGCAAGLGEDARGCARMCASSECAVRGEGGADGIWMKSRMRSRLGIVSRLVRLEETLCHSQALLAACCCCWCCDSRDCSQSHRRVAADAVHSRADYAIYSTTLAGWLAEAPSCMQSGHGRACSIR